MASSPCHVHRSVVWGIATTGRRDTTPLLSQNLNAAKLLTKDEARRIAVNIAKLPEQFDLDQITSFRDPL